MGGYAIRNMERRTPLAYVPYLLVGVLAVVTVFVWHAVLASDGRGKLRVAFLNVGQGDAIYIEAPNGNRVLIDGGKGRAILEGLGKMMPFSDRSIDVVIATHPDLDHIGGLPEVFARYDVGMFIEPGIADGGADNEALHEAVRDEGLVPVTARRGMTLALDEGVTLEILFPDRDASGLEANMASVVTYLAYGESKFLFTGDSPIAIEQYLASVYGTVLKSDVLKLGHHGSKTSTSDVWLGFVDPDYGIISAGCDNSYGHPHHEVVDRLKRFEVQALTTCDEGTIVFESDGIDPTLDL